MQLGFIALFNGKKLEIRDASSLYDAQCKAAALWNVKPSQRYKIAVVLCEKDGQQVTHDTASL